MIDQWEEDGLWYCYFQVGKIRTLGFSPDLLEATRFSIEAYLDKVKTCGGC